MKKSLAGFLIVVFSTIAAGMYATRDIPPTHPILRASDLPPLIPTYAFYADPRAEFGYVPSSDGKYVALETASILGRNFVVREVASGTDIAEFPINLSHVRWHPTKHLLRFIHEGSDWEADPFNPEPVNWKRISPVKLSGGWVKSEIAANDDAKLLTWGKIQRSSPGHLFLVSQDGLETKQISEGSARTQYWVVDTQKKPVLRVDSIDQATQTVFRREGNNWIPLVDVHLDDVFFPVSLARLDGTVLFRSSRGRDKTALVAFDIETGEEEVLVENQDTDIGGVTYLTYTQEPDVVRMGNNSLDRVALTERGHVFLDILNQFPQPVSLGLTKPTASGRYVAQALSIQSKSYIYLLIDLEEKSHTLLSEYHFRRFKEHLIMGKAIRFPARDGLNIPAILTLPKTVKGPIPFIVYIHGGPAGNASVGYDHDTQFLVNRGYGVLSVNYRGSTGFGKAFQAKGFKEFGRAMQDDIADAAGWLVTQGLADPDALVAMGASYGGYSAALAMTRDPGLFSAAIVEFPMLDTEFQTKYRPGFWDQGMHGWWRYFGKTDNEDDLEMMRKYSPSNLIDQLHGPLLVLGGVRDQITAVQQVRDFEVKARAAGKDVEVHYFADAGHGVRHWRDRFRRARLLENFLAEQVGGRSGGFDLAEWIPEFID